MELALVVRRVSEHSSVALGTTIFLRSGLVIGRSTDADACLSDPTVSREHVRVAIVSGKTTLFNQSADNGLFIDGHAVPPGASAVLAATGGRVQIGGVVCEIVVSEETLPVRDPLTLGAPPVAEHNTPRLKLTLDGDACAAYWDSVHLDLSPAAARALLALCRAPGTVVHEWDIQSAVGARCNVPQLMSSIRRALLSLIESGVLKERCVREWIELGGSTDVRDLTGSPLLRRFLFARRGHGYALFVPPGVVHIDEAG